MASWCAARGQTSRRNSYGSEAADCADSRPSVSAGIAEAGEGSGLADGFRAQPRPLRQRPPEEVMRAVFADTFYFLALLNRRDPFHERAVSASRTPDLSIVTTEFVLLELADALCSA